MIKERRTDDYVFFVSGPFSQWHQSAFIEKAWPSELPITWAGCEQFMMAGKALLFHDFDIYNQILKETNPKKIKALGRMIQNFDEIIWKNNARDIVLRGNLAKFRQNEKLKSYLLNTGDRKMVEGAWYDPVWGVGLAWDDPMIENPDNWKGTNWLGEILNIVRDSL